MLSKGTTRNRGMWGMTATLGGDDAAHGGGETVDVVAVVIDAEADAETVAPVIHDHVVVVETSVDLAGLVQRAVAPHLGEHRAILVKVEPGLRALGHDERLERVIGHLIQNAVDATRSNGTIRVEASRQGDFSVVDIEDDGRGMTPEFVRDHLFKPFHSTKPAGMGIGTYESHQYVTELGGRITVDSTADVGTRMRICLPMPPTEASDKDRGPQRAAA